jgi:hypothetical protein
MLFTIGLHSILGMKLAVVGKQGAIPSIDPPVVDEHVREAGWILEIEPAGNLVISQSFFARDATQYSILPQASL